MIPWTVPCQASLSMGFPRQEYWNGLPFPSPGDLPDPRIKPASPAWQVDSLPLRRQVFSIAWAKSTSREPGPQWCPTNPAMMVVSLSLAHGGCPGGAAARQSPPRSVVVTSRVPGPLQPGVGRPGGDLPWPWLRPPHYPTLFFSKSAAWLARRSQSSALAVCRRRRASASSRSPTCARSFLFSRSRPSFSVSSRSRRPHSAAFSACSRSICNRAGQREGSTGRGTARPEREVPPPHLLRQLFWLQEASPAAAAIINPGLFHRAQGVSKRGPPLADWSTQGCGWFLSSCE